MLNPELTLRKLEILLAFMEKQHIGRAAEKLGMSNVSVHRALHSLEEVLHCPLFAHNGRNLLPLPAAETLARYASELIAMTHRAVEATRETAGFSNGRIRLGSLYSLTTDFVPRLILGLKQRRPELQIDLSMDSNQNMMAKLQDHHLDAVLLSLKDRNQQISGMETLPLFEDPLYLAAASHAKVTNLFPDSGTIDLKAFQNERFVALNEGFATAQGASEAFKTAGFKPDTVTQLDDIFSMMNLVQAGVGCAIVPKRICHAYSQGVVFAELDRQYQNHQQIAMIFPRSKERDPDMLSLIAEARMTAKSYRT